MEKITADRVIDYGRMLADWVLQGDLAASTAQNRVSAINSVMELATPRWIAVSPTQDCWIPARSGIAKSSKAIAAAEHQRLCEKLRQQDNQRLATLLELHRALGLRFEESAKLDARSALQQARDKGEIPICAGTKGGRKRLVPASRQAIAALELAASLQGKERSMIPVQETYAEFQDRAYRELQKAGGFGFHGERHHYAQARYEDLCGAPSPVAAGWSRRERLQRLGIHLSISLTTAKALDARVRLQIAEELGHGRIEVTDAYLG